MNHLVSSKQCPILHGTHPQDPLSSTQYLGNIPCLAACDSGKRRKPLGKNPALAVHSANRNRSWTKLFDKLVGEVDPDGHIPQLLESIC